MGKIIDLTGKRFGGWAVLEWIGPNENKQTCWRCRCDCGVEKIVVGQTLREGLSSSCGCQLAERVSRAKITHGQSKSKANNGLETRTYRIWCAMHKRCKGDSYHSWKYYWRRGIAVCERWNSFENFLSDMGPCRTGLSIDRIDNDGNYEPANCRWATSKEQRANQRPYGSVS